ncbi:MAG: 50S ribosomal protein L18 [candidate division NC10 bacterium]|nr:50S ribosomal protein L18 [candidate division NC10 bacterium]
MKGNYAKREARIKRHRRVRKKVVGTRERPRLSVFKSNRHIYVQLVDDDAGHTLTAASSLSPQIVEGKEWGDKKGVAKAVGKLVGEAALRANIKKVVFDRGGYRYHGRVKALADGAREAGLEF